MTNEIDLELACRYAAYHLAGPERRRFLADVLKCDMTNIGIPGEGWDDFVGHVKQGTIVE